MFMKKATEENLSIQDQIIESAGQIYNYLSQNGEVTIKKILKDIKLKEEITSMGLGWLSREDKLEYIQNPRSISVKLR